MKNLTAWDRVQIARSPERKTSLDYIENIFDEFFELHGDRNCKDDKSIVCGLAKIGNQNFTVIAEQKGRNTKENIERNFGMPNPESYRKAIRFMNQAEKFNRPVITFIDTKGAYSGVEAEKMKLTAKDLYELKVIDKIIREDNVNFENICENIKKEIIKNINKMNKLSKEELVNDRYNKFRNMGEYIAK